MMKIMYQLVGLSCMTMLLAACQSTPRQFNGMTGYQIENKTSSSATLAYTLAGRANDRLDEQKLQRACQKVLGTKSSYKISVLSVNEISNPAMTGQGNSGIALGNTRTSIGLSNTQSMYSTEDLATRQALESRPSTLSVVRYTCS